MSEKICKSLQKEFTSPVTFKHPVILTHKSFQPKTMNGGNFCDEKPVVVSNTSLIPKLNQKKVCKKYFAKNEAKVEWIVKHHYWGMIKTNS